MLETLEFAVESLHLHLLPVRLTLRSKDLAYHDDFVIVRNHLKPFGILRARGC